MTDWQLKLMRPLEDEIIRLRAEIERQHVEIKALRSIAWEHGNRADAAEERLRASDYVPCPGCGLRNHDAEDPSWVCPDFPKCAEALIAAEFANSKA